MSEDVWASENYSPDPGTYSEQGGSAYDTGYGAGSPGYEWSGSESEGGWSEGAAPGWYAPEAEPTQADQMRQLYPEWNPSAPGASYYDYLQSLAAINPALPAYAQIYGGVENIPSWLNVSQPWQEALYGGWENVPQSLLMSPEAGAAAYAELAAGRGKTYEQAIAHGGTLVGGLMSNPYTGNWTPVESLYHMTSPPDIAALMSQGGEMEFNPFTGGWTPVALREEGEPRVLRQTMLGGNNMREYGERNPDGSVTVWQTDDAGNYTPIRTESYAQNQGQTNVGANPNTTGYNPPATVTNQPGPGTTTGLSNIASLLSGMSMPAMPQMNVAPTAQLSEASAMAQFAANQEYLRKRMEMLEIPQMMQLTEAQRHATAVDAAVRYSELTGYAINPNFFEAQIEWATGFPAGTAASVGTTGGTTAPAAMPSAPQMAEIRNRLQQAGWGGGTDAEAVQAFMRTAVAEDTDTYRAAQAYVAGGGGGGTTTGGEINPLTPNITYPGQAAAVAVGPGSANPTPTLARSQFEEAQRQYNENLAFQKQQYLTNLQANPRTFTQTLLAGGMSPQQAAGTLNQMPLVQQLQGMAMPGQTTTGQPPNVGIAGGAQAFQSPGPGGLDPMAVTAFAQMHGMTYEQAAAALAANQAKGAPNVGIPGMETPSAIAPGTLDPQDPQIQRLMAQGYTFEQAVNIYTQNLAAGQAKGATLTGGTNIMGGVGTVAGQATRNPAFPFISGYQMPVRETLAAQQANSSLIPLVESLASYSGQDPNAFWGSFQQALPKGTQNPLSRYGW